jgi:hypothetical protein
VIIKHLRASITAGVLSLLLLAAAHLFLSAYHQHRLDLAQHETLHTRLRMARQQQSETLHRQQVLLQVKAFLDLADALKMDKMNWSVYDIQLEEPVTRSELKQILEQCQNTPSYYFRPTSFHAKTADSPDVLLSQMTKSDMDDGSAAAPGDILLSLKGAFLVREE